MFAEIFKDEKKMFKDGGKMESAVNLFSKGGRYNRKDGRKNKKDDGISGFDYRTRGKQNVKSKIAKASAVEGFDGREFIDPEDFDRQTYRDRKRYAKENYQDLSRRQRKKYALLKDVEIDARDVDNYKDIYIPRDLGIRINRPTIADISVGDMSYEFLPDPETPSVKTNYPSVKTNYPPDSWWFDGPAKASPASWDQFFYENYYRDINTSGEMHPGQTILGYQRALEDEYEKYYDNPESYVRGSIDPAVMKNYHRAIMSGREKLKYGQPQKGYGYYDPDAHYVKFGEKQAPLMWSDEYNGLANIGKGIAGTTAVLVAAPIVAEGAVQFAKDATRGFNNAINNARQSVTQNPSMLQQNRSVTWSQSRLPNGRFGPNVYKDKGFTKGFGDGYGNMAPHAGELYKPGMPLSGEVAHQLPSWMRSLIQFSKIGKK